MERLYCVYVKQSQCNPRSSRQRVRDRRPVGRRPVRAEDLPAAAGAEAGQVHAGAQETAGGPHEDHGQRGHLLHAAHAFHLHLQVRLRYGCVCVCVRGYLVSRSDADLGL